MKWKFLAVCGLGLGITSTANAANYSYEETLAPVVTASCCDNSCGATCDSGCGETSCDSGFFGCGGGCDGGCDSGCGCDSGLLGYGLVKKSDTCFNDFISPMTNPVFFEDPRSLTEARFIFLHHELPAALGGNSVQVYALQVRARLTERLSLIATKDGLIYTQSSLPILDSGYADIAAGFKYNLYRDVCNGTLLSTGFTYEIPTGSSKSLQGNGNGVLNLFVTGGTRIGERGHWISAGGLLEPMDDSLENRMMYWSNHFDVQVPDRPLWMFSEVNWYNYQSSGSGLGVEGGDLFNFGSSNVTGNDIVTGALGMKVKPADNIEIGSAYEVPLTAREGVMQSRFTFDMIVRY